MRGTDKRSGELFSYVDLEKRVRQDHPLRPIREIVNATLKALSAEFDALYSPAGRESIPPERLLRALLLQAFYSIRSERQLVERIEFDLLFRWFVGLGVDDPVWDATTFTKNRDRLLEGDIARRFLAAVLVQPQVKALLSGEHFSVDGTLLEAWASTKSFRAKDGSGPPADPGRTTRHPGYAVSLRIRKRIEEAFGWAKTVAGLRKARHRGLAKIDWQFTFAMAAYNLVRLPKLLGAVT